MKYKLFLTLFYLGGSFAAVATEQLPLNAHLESLRPLLEKTWKGTFKDSKPGKPTVDVQRWERALNGQAIRILHSINDGAYGGETLLIWDEPHKTISFYYFTTDGFMTTGTLELKDGRFITHEDVKGAANGVTEVRATSEILPDGKIHVKAEYLKNGEWTPGHEATYEEVPGSKIVFK
jgi:hypothetical protein